MMLVGVPKVLEYSRPRRSAPGQVHTVMLDGPTLAPLDIAHACTCPAGQTGTLCWAVLEVLYVEAVAEAGHRYMLVGDSGKAEAEQLLRDVVQRGCQAGHLLATRSARSKVA